MKIKVDQPSEKHISSIELIHQSEDVIVLYVDLNTKHAKVWCFEQMDGWVIFSVKDSQIHIEIPQGFESNVTMADTCKYEMYITVIRTEALVEGPTLWSESWKQSK